MKAKEMARAYIEAEDNKKDEKLGELLQGLSKDFLRIQHERKVNTDAGLIGICRDLEKKYKSFARRVNAHYSLSHIREDGFLIWVDSIYPELAEFYKKSKC